MRVVLLAGAEQDLKELRSYLVKNISRLTWQKTYDQIKVSIGNLATHPYMGVIPDELEALQLAQYRQILASKNRVIYEVRQDTVFIHVIMDTRRDMMSFLMARLVR
jgi:plasmid stabilization system protein ParE